ncbi:MAG: DUF2752 domain-containing protein [Acidobacteriota bacterium]
MHGRRFLGSIPPGVASHLVVLSACVSILVLALWLEPPGPDATHLRIGGMSLPGLCVLRETTGIPCPGCGLSRSLVSVAHGDWYGGFRQHRLGAVVLAYLCLQVLYRLAWLGLPYLRPAVARTGRVVDGALAPLMGLIFLNWLPTLWGVLS